MGKFLLGVTLFILVVASASQPAFARSLQENKTLDFYSLHAAQSFSYVLTGNREYNLEQLKNISDLMKDNTSQPAKMINPKLLDFLFEIKLNLLMRYPHMKVVFNILSGYRSREHNEARRNDENNPYRGSMAKKSQHSEANALDFYVEGIDDEELRDIAWCLQLGGVGYYPKHVAKSQLNYIHIDVGRVRFWGGDFYFPGIQCN